MVKFKLHALILLQLEHTPLLNGPVLSIIGQDTDYLFTYHKLSEKHYNVLSVHYFEKLVNKHILTNTSEIKYERKMH